jgi:hypothetical protein
MLTLGPSFESPSGAVLALFRVLPVATVSDVLVDPAGYPQQLKAMRG